MGVPISHLDTYRVLYLNVKLLVGAFNQEKAIVGAFSVIVQPVVEPMEHYTALASPNSTPEKAYSCRVMFMVSSTRSSYFRRKYLNMCQCQRIYLVYLPFFGENSCNFQIIFKIGANVINVTKFLSPMRLFPRVQNCSRVSH